MFLFAFLFVWFSALNEVRASSLTFVSDTISTSRPEVNANHTIKFTVTNTIPASDKIIITPQSGAFTIPAGLDHTDIDFLVGSTNQSLASSPGIGAGSAIGVSLASGTSGNIVFTLNDTDAIFAGSTISIKIGTDAIFADAGDQQIANPATVGSYRIHIQTQDISDSLIDQAFAMIAIVSPVSATSQIEAPPSPPPSPPSGGGGGGGGGAVPSVPAPPTSPPTIFIDGPGEDVTVSGTINIGGWALDNVAEIGTAISGVAVFIDGAFQGNATFGLRRPDVCAIYPARLGCPNVGFEFLWDTTGVADGIHTIRLDVTDSDTVPQTSSVFRSVTVSNLPVIPTECRGADFNLDGIVDTTDFSILLFFWQTNPPFRNVCVDINKDSKVNSIDFSILLFQWGSSGIVASKTKVELALATYNVWHNSKEEIKLL